MIAQRATRKLKLWKEHFKSVFEKKLAIKNTVFINGPESKSAALRAGVAGETYGLEGGQKNEQESRCRS
jgi:hypothetical protein